MNNAHDLLRRFVDIWEMDVDSQGEVYLMMDLLVEEIRAWIAAAPARKPMTEEEIEDIYYSGLTFENTYLAAFVEGFRQAEKHHNITDEPTRG